MWKDKCKLSKVCARFLPSCRCTLWLFTLNTNNLGQRWLPVFFFIFFWCFGKKTTKFSHFIAMVGFCSQGHAEFHRMWVNCDCEWVNYRLWLTLWDHFPHESPGWATSLPAWQRDSLRCYTCSHCLDRMAALIDGPPPFDVPSLKLFVCVASRCRRRELMTLSPDTSAVLFFFHSCIVKPNRPQSDINWMRNTQAVSESKVAEATLTPTWTNTGTLFRSGNYFKPDF